MCSRGGTDRDCGKRPFARWSQIQSMFVKRAELPGHTVNSLSAVPDDPHVSGTATANEARAVTATSARSRLMRWSTSATSCAGCRSASLCPVEHVTGELPYRPRQLLLGVTSSRSASASAASSTTRARTSSSRSPRTSSPRPDRAEQLVAKAHEYAPRADVYVCPLLRTERSRKSGSGSAGRYAWADLDEEPAAGWNRLLLGPSSFVVGSGNGKHPYLWLPEPMPAPELEQLNRRLATTLDADAGWLVGDEVPTACRNPDDKGRAVGLRAPVTFLDVERGPRDWTLPQLDELLLPVPTPSAPVEPVTPAALPPRVATRLAESPQGDRSAQSFSFLALCVEQGLTDEHTLALALRHAPTVEKYGTRVSTEVARVLGKIRADTPEPEPFVLDLAAPATSVALPDPPNDERAARPALSARPAARARRPTPARARRRWRWRSCARVVTGGDFLGWQGWAVRALVIDAEQGCARSSAGYARPGSHECDELDYMRVPDGLALDSDAQHVAEVERVLERGDYALVVADPLYKLHAGDSNAEREAVDLMRRFDGWRERFGFALVLPVHCRKPVPGSKFSIHDLFGSSAYVRGAEVVLGLQRVRDGYSQLHFLKDRDGDLPIATAWGLLFAATRASAATRRRQGRRRHTRRTARGACRWRVVTLNELRRKKDDGGIGADRKTLRPALDALTAEGLLEHQIGPPGRHHAANCWRVASASNATHATSLFTSLSGDTGGGRWRCGVSRQRSNTHDATTTDTALSDAGSGVDPHATSGESAA